MEKPPMAATMITENEENFFKFIERVQNFESLEEDDFKKILLELNPDLRNDKNFKSRSVQYFLWYKQDFVQDVMQRKKEELRNGIRRMAKPSDWSQKCFMFRKWIEQNWSAVKCTKVDDEKEMLKLIRDFTDAEQLDPHPYWTMRIKNDYLQTVFREVQELIQRKQSQPPSKTQVQTKCAPKEKSQSESPPKTQEQTKCAPNKKSQPPPKTQEQTKCAPKEKSQSQPPTKKKAEDKCVSKESPAPSTSNTQTYSQPKTQPCAQSTPNMPQYQTCPQRVIQSKYLMITHKVVRLFFALRPESATSWPLR